MGVLDMLPPKAPGVRCVQVCSRGCRVYAERPQSCRDFACVWVQGGLPKWMRPDKVGIVFTVDQDGERLVGFWDPARPLHWLRQVRGYLLALGLQGADVVVGPAGGQPQRAYGLHGELFRPEGI